MDENPARLLAGRVILSGMVSLFVGLALIVIGMFLLERMGIRAGDGFLTAGKIFTGLWLPLVLFGALMRMSSGNDQPDIKHCGACGRPRPAAEDFCPYCTAPAAPTPPRPRSGPQVSDTHLETRWGGGPVNPTLEELQAALKELDTVDEEHPSAWLSDRDGWTVDVYEGGLVIVSEEGATLCERRGVTREQALELWLLLQQGKRDEIVRRMT